MNILELCSVERPFGKDLRKCADTPA